MRALEQAEIRSGQVRSTHVLRVLLDDRVEVCSGVFHARDLGETVAERLKRGFRRRRVHVRFQHPVVERLEKDRGEGKQRARQGKARQVSTDERLHPPRPTAGRDRTLLVSL